MKKIPVTVRLTLLLKQNAEILAELRGKTLNEYIVELLANESKRLITVPKQPHNSRADDDEIDFPF